MIQAVPGTLKGAMVRITLLMSAFLMAGCASQPPDREGDARRVADALKHGYQVVNSEGETLYCRSDFTTGSRIQKNTVCLTAQQLDDWDQRNQRLLYTPPMPIRNP
jgi:hypothetical protein